MRVVKRYAIRDVTMMTKAIVTSSIALWRHRCLSRDSAKVPQQMHSWGMSSLLRTHFGDKVMIFVKIIGKYLSIAIIHTQYDCCSQMNSNLLISTVKFTRYASKFDVSNQQIWVQLWATVVMGPYIIRITMDCSCYTFVKWQCTSSSDVKDDVTINIWHTNRLERKQVYRDGIKSWIYIDHLNLYSELELIEWCFY